MTCAKGDFTLLVVSSLSEENVVGTMYKANKIMQCNINAKCNIKVK